MTIPLVHHPRRRSTALVGAVVAICLALTGLTAQSASAADTGSITGAVFTQAVGGTKTPADGGYLYVYRLDADGYFDSVDSDPTDPDTDGYSFTGSTFELGGLAAGTYTFEVARVDTGDATVYQREYYNDAEYLHDATPIQVGTTKVQLPDMVLEQAGQISGRVTDAAGKPVAGASVMFERTRSGGSRGVQTDANGYYTSVQDPSDGFGEGLVRGDYRVVASRYSSSSDPDAPSYEAEYWNDATSYDSATPVTVQPGKTATNIDFTLAEAPRVRLTAKDPAGVPIPNADVGIYVFHEGAWAPYAAGPNVTDPDGVYRKTVRIGERYKFFIEPPAGVGGVTEWYDNAYSEATAREVTATSHGQVINIEIKLGPAPEVVGSAPTITGTPRSGSTLVASPGAWGPAGVSVAYQWLADGAPIPGATGAQLRLTNAQAGKRITVTATGSLPGAAPVTTTSAATSAVKGVLTPKKVSITGTAKVGKKLRARTSSWGPSPVRSSYTWYRNGKRIPGQTKSTYTVRKADAGKRITVRITRTKSNYVSAKKVSAKTSKVRKR